MASQDADFHTEAGGADVRITGGNLVRINLWKQVKCLSVYLSREKVIKLRAGEFNRTKEFM